MVQAALFVSHGKLKDTALLVLCSEAASSQVTENRNISVLFEETEFLHPSNRAWLNKKINIVVYYLCLSK